LSDSEIDALANRVAINWRDVAADPNPRPKRAIGNLALHVGQPRNLYNRPRAAPELETGR
jgi:hypothetical protein